MKLLMLKFRFLLVFLLVNIILGCSDISNQKTIVFFENPQFLEQEENLLIALGDINSHKNLYKFLNNQNWINSFLIKKNFFKPLEIFIESKEPKYIWQEKFYLDKNLSKFSYFFKFSPSIFLIFFSAKKNKSLWCIGSANLKFLIPLC